MKAKTKTYKKERDEMQKMKQKGWVKGKGVDDAEDEAEMGLVSEGKRKRGMRCRSVCSVEGICRFLLFLLKQ